MINFDDIVNQNKRGNNPKWPYVPDSQYQILLIGGSGWGKRNVLLNLISNEPDIDKIYLQKIIDPCIYSILQCYVRWW